MLTAELSTRLRNMSFFAACLVVLLHSTPEIGEINLVWWFSMIFCREGVCGIAVPYFFMVSGYFLAKSAERGNWWSVAVKKRVFTLLVPFYIWMLVYAIFGAAVNYVKGVAFPSICSFAYFVKILGVHPFEDVGPLWFVRCLFLLVLISPILIRSLKVKWFILAFMFLLYGALIYFLQSGISAKQYFMLDRFFTIRGLLYFYLGMCLSTLKNAIELSSKRCLMFLLTGFVLLLLRNYGIVAKWKFLVATCEVLYVSLLIGGGIGVMPARPIVSWLSQNSFPIYLMHNLYVSVAAFMLLKFDLSGPDDFFLTLTIKFVFALCASLVSVIILRHSFPKFAIVLFGGR